MAELSQKLVKEFKDIMSTYKEEASTDTLNALVLGYYGSGKTHLLSTAPKPLVIDSFDPGGTKTLRDSIASGGVYPTLYEGEKRSSPTEFGRWERNFERRVREGFFENVGTYAIDSMTGWCEAMLNEIARANARKENLPALKDYMIALKTITDSLRLCLSLPCHFVLTGHIVQDKDEVSGGYVTTINTFKSARAAVPPLFDDIYVVKVEQQAPPKPPKRRLLTDSDGVYYAKSRGGKLNMYEEPNFRDILQKLGLPYEDKQIV